MKALFERIENLSFKKAFITFFAAFFVFVVAYFSHMAANGQWSVALNSERSRMEIMRGSVTEQEAGAIRARVGHLRRGWFERLNRNPGDRFLHGAARVWHRITSAEFGVYNLLARLFWVTFNILLALWVYVNSKKHEKNKVFWPVLTLFTSIIGWLIYMIARENKRYIPKTANEA